MGAQHPECPERIGAIHDLLLIKVQLNYMQTYDAPLATDQQLGRAHSMQYVHELAAQVPTSGYTQIDPDTLMNPYTYQAALRAAVLATVGRLCPEARINGVTVQNMSGKPYWPRTVYRRHHRSTVQPL